LEYQERVECKDRDSHTEGDMTLKTKLILGLGFLFLIIFSLAVFCSYYVGRLGQESDNILKDNYYSIVYSKNMLSSLDKMKTSITSTMYNTGRVATMSDYYLRLFESGRKVFEDNLKAENNNITEIHEKEYVDKLNQDYDSCLKLSLQIKSGSVKNSVFFNDFLPACEKLKESINAIHDINMQAVVRKSQLAKHDSASFINSMAIIGSICLVLALAYFWYFPVYISTTLSYLSGRMRNLLKNSGVVFDIKTNDEAYIILHAINLLENKLGMKKENIDFHD
jgi:NtrC-family two-component system sensor histidine kinase KinB